MVNKILRSLTKDFCTKVTIIEDHEKLNTLKLKELIGNLRTFEFGLCQSNFHLKSQKSKGLALSSTKIDNPVSNEDGDFDPKEMVVFVEKFQKFYKKQKPKTNGFQYIKVLQNAKGKNEWFSKHKRY